MRVLAIPDLGMGDGSFALKLPYFITDNVWIAPNGNFYYHYNLGKEDVVVGCQLERQDQLQEMVKLNQHNVSTIFPALLDFHFCSMYEAVEDEFLTNDKGTELTDWHQRQFKSARHFRHRFISMEQLWLAYVMKEKYGKAWNGEEWVSEKVVVRS